MSRSGSPARLRRGQAAVSVRARGNRVAVALLKHAPVLMIVSGVPGGAAWIEGEEALALALLVPTGLCALLALWSLRWESPHDLRRIEAVATLALVFVISALLAVPGFIALGLPALDAVFEAASGITTTGLSVARDAETWPISGHLLRAWMQWCGGVVVAVAGVALLMDSGRAAQAIGKQSVGEAGYYASTRGKARLILSGYVVLTVLGMLIALPLFPGWWEGPVIALAAVSTGGFSPRDTSLADYSTAAQIFTLVLCVCTSVSLLFYAIAFKHGPRAAIRSGTVTMTLAILGIGGLATLVSQILLTGWNLEAAGLGVLNYLSAQTTAGFSATPVAPLGPLAFLLIAAMILGGDVGSTTGGRVGLVFLRLRLPARAISHLKIGEKRADAEAILFAAALLWIYLIAALIFWTALYTGGHAALPALFDSVSALSGVGLSAGVIGPDLAAPLKALAIFAMLLGRLEFFVLIALILPSTWIKRS